MRRTATFAAVTAVAGLSLVALGPTAEATVTTTNVTSPVDGATFMVTSESPPPILVQGTSDGVFGDNLNLRCYYGPTEYDVLNVNTIPVNPDGTFSVNIDRDAPYSTCRLRAVPVGWPDGSSVSSFTGPRVTTEVSVPQIVQGGPNDGKVFDYYVLFQGEFASNDYRSATIGGLYDTRLQAADGTMSGYFWAQNGALSGNEGGVRSYLQVDGRNGYGPFTAWARFPDNPGFPELTYTASRNVTTGVTTIHETDPIVACSTETAFPPTAGSCPSFVDTGVRLDRTIVTDDGGRQVHVSDVWRSTDGQAHTISAHYEQAVGGAGLNSVGHKLPWMGSAYQVFTSTVNYPAPPTVPATVFVRNDTAAPDGDTFSPRGAITFDVRPSSIHRPEYRKVVLRNDGITVPAGGTRLVHQDFVIGTTEAEVANKAAANEARYRTYRPDTMIRKKSASAYLGNNVYNVTGAGQTAGVRKKRSRTATFVLRVQNDGSAVDSFTLKGTGSRTGFAVRYLAGASGTTNITTAVKNGTYRLANLAAGQSRYVRLVVKVKAGARRGAIRSWLVLASSTHNSARRDAAKATVRVRR